MSLEDILRPHQQTSVENIVSGLARFDSFCDCSETGTGKTAVACAVSAILRLPTLVIAPKISLSAWHRTAAWFGEKISCVGYEKLRTGNTPFGSWEHQEQLNSKPKAVFFCEICQRKFSEDEQFEPCPYNAFGTHCFSTRTKPRRYGKFIFNDAVKLAILDEAHRCGGIDSLNADMLFAAKRQNIKTLLLSATLAQNPLGLNAIGYALGLHNGPHDDVVNQKPSFFRWAGRYGVRRDPAFHGLKWFAGAERQKQVMAEIRASIADRSVRVQCSEIPGFPDQDIEACLYDIEADLDKIYAEMSSAIAQLNDTATSDVDPEHPLTKILRAQQKIEICKVPLAVEIAQDCLAKGFSTVLFVNFKATLEELAKRLACPFIDGSVLAGARDKVIADFQTNEIRCMVVNSAVGGITISLQDLDGEHPRQGLVFPPWSAVVIKQLFGRFRREGGKSKSHFKVLLAAGSEVEQKIHRSLQSKLNALDSLNDGDLQPENLKLRQT